MPAPTTRDDLNVTESLNSPAGSEAIGTSLDNYIRSHAAIIKQYVTDVADGTSASKGSSLVGFLPAGTGAVATTVQSKLRESVSLKDFGAVGDGVTDDTAATQAWINAVIAKKATGCVPPPSSFYKLTGTGVLINDSCHIVGPGMNVRAFENDNGNCFRLSGVHINVTELRLKSAGGHTVVQTGDVNQCTWTKFKILQASNGFSCWDNGGFGYLDNRMSGFYLEHVSAATAPGWNVTSTGGNCNDNIWENGRVTYSGNYFWNIEATGAFFQWGNQWRNINFEVCNGGGIRQVAARGFAIENCQNWDAALVGVITKDFYRCEANASAFGIKGVIRNCFRAAGSNNAGIFDVKLPATGGFTGVVIDSCVSESPGAPFSIDCNSNSAVVIKQGSLTSVSNGSAATVIDATAKSLSFGGGNANWYQTVADTMTTDGNVHVSGVFRSGVTSGSGHTVQQSNASTYVFNVNNSNASPFGGLSIVYNAAAPNGTGNLFLACGDTGANRFQVRSNGGLANFQANNVNLSDIRWKTDIKPAGQYWEKVKSLEVVSYLYKDQTDNERNLGVIAQQVDSVAPELVDHSGEFGRKPVLDTEGRVVTDEDGNPVLEPIGPDPFLAIYQTDMQYAVLKALQEAMCRIEDLEKLVLNK